MTAAAGRPLHIRLFLEGVEVPVIGAVIQSQKNTPATCSIQLPANDYVMDLLPRTLVHLFSLDVYGSYTPDNVSVQGEGISREGTGFEEPDSASFLPPERFETTAEQQMVDLINQGYKLIFCGELHGVSFSKTPMSRSAYLQCLDLSNYWDSVFQFQVSGMSLGGGSIQSRFSGASTNVFNDMFRGSGDIITELLNTAPRSFPHMGGTLLGGIMNIIETVGGTYWGNQTFRGTNDFFSLAEMRLHLTQMVGANPYRESDESQLLHARGFDSLFRRSLSGLGREVTIRKILLALQRYIFHEIVPINAPKYIPPEYDPNVPQISRARLSENTETLPIHQAATRMRRHIEELKDRQLECTTADRLDSATNRRGGLRNELYALMRQANATARQAQNVANAQGLSTSLSEVVNGFKTIQQLLGRVVYIVARGQRTTVTRHSFWLVPSPQVDETMNLFDTVVGICDRILRTEYPRRIRRSTHQPEPPPRLLSQLYVPDVWMVAPPRCNVIFPEQYSQFQYARSFTQEVTRLLLRTNSAFFGSDFLFDSFYMVPSNIVGQRFYRTVGAGAVGQDREQTDAPVWFRRDMMDHELFTGIVPAFERMSELNLHALRGGDALIENNRVPYAILAANHIFFQYRFRTRNLQLSGPFNPYVVLGFPAAVVDRPKTIEEMLSSSSNMAFAADLAERVREGEGQYGAITEDQRQAAIEANDTRVAEVTLELLADRPQTHYLGTPQMIAHSLDVNSGGTTQIQMGYARTNNERSEFFEDNVARTPRARRTSTRRRATVVASLRPPTVGHRGFLGGDIIEVTDVTDQYTPRTTGRRRGAREQGNLPLFVDNERGMTGRRRRGTTVPVGVSRPARTYGPEVVALVGTGGADDASVRMVSSEGDAELMVTFRAYRILETVGTYRMDSRPLPPEDYTFPPWYGEHYRTNRIGGLYSYFFGTGAITDATVVLGAQSAPTEYEPDSETQTEAQGFLTIMRSMVSGEMELPNPDSSPIPGSTEVPEEGGEMVGPPGTDTPGAQIAGQVPEQAPLAFALEEIVRTYSRLKLGKFDVHDFVRSYTWRPIASMVDLFGTANLEIDNEGTVVRGAEGFHSRAFGDFDDLRQLVGAADGRRPRTIIGISTQDTEEDGPRSPQQISARLDTRKEKRIQVLKYLYRQLSACGIRG